MNNDILKIDQYYYNYQNEKINSLKNKIQNNNNSTEPNFSKMLDNKLSADNNIKNLNKNEKKLLNSCIELESFFWKQVLNSMKKTTGKYKLLDGGQAEEIFSDMLYDEYSMLLAKNANSNISIDMFKQLSKYL